MAGSVRSVTGLFHIVRVLAIMKLHDFLVEHAKFPFPLPTSNEDRTVGITDISQLEVGLLEREWKAGHAVRDDTLVQKLCQTLKDILGDTPLAADAENYFLVSFSPLLQVDERGRENLEWNKNPSEVQVGITRTLDLHSDCRRHRVGRC